MPLSHQACYDALTARDPRFDGRFFVGVTSTGIYCRPICRVRLPKPQNCQFFQVAAQAEALGFRPCLRCRPELATGSHAQLWSINDASATLSSHAMQALQLGAAKACSVAEVAANIGVTPRHLSRLAQAHWGVSPQQVMQTKRLLLAKQWLSDSRLPVAQVAHLSGFRSLSQFHAAFRQHYKLTPNAIRKPLKTGAAQGHGIDERVKPALRLCYRLPLHLGALAAFVDARAIKGLELVQAHANGVHIWRLVSLTPTSVGVNATLARVNGWVSVAFTHPTPAQQLAGMAYATVCCSSSLWPHWAQLRVVLERWLDLGAQPRAIAHCLDQQLPQQPQQLGSPWSSQHHWPDEPIAGIRLIGAVDTFEVAVRAIIGQQVSVAGAKTVAQRLVMRFGQLLDDDLGPTDLGVGLSLGLSRLFPVPSALAHSAPADWQGMGLTQQKIVAIQALAQAIDSRQIVLSLDGRYAPQAHEHLIEQLRALPGIGPWTAHYVVMRCLSWPDAWLAGDVVLKRMGRQLGLAPVSMQQMKTCSPWRSYAVMRLWAMAAS